MRPLIVVAFAVLGLVAAPLGASAQAWNSDAALALARRAIERRDRTASDTALRDYKAQAHGFLFFLGQFGEGLTEPARLVKADQLELEVYWKAPQLSKQRIVGWRDRAELPTDITYHRDHLGIVQNNFGRVVRLGEGDEVRDVPHPLAPGGTELYDFALGDTVTLVLPQRAVRVVALRVRPKDFGQARLVGTLFVDAETADLVRLAFNFTPRAYLDPQLEDVSVVLDNALWEGRFWLPYRQEVEIRRRATWLDIPARGIIRGRWEIDGYVFNVGLADRWFAGEEIVALPKAQRDSFPWSGPLATAIQDIAEPVRQGDLQAVRAEVARIAGRRALSGLRAQRLGVRGVSDVLRANRVEGLSAGAGFVWRVPGDQLEARALASYGFADRRLHGAVALASGGGGGTRDRAGWLPPGAGRGRCARHRPAAQFDRVAGIRGRLWRLLPRDRRARNAAARPRRPRRVARIGDPRARRIARRARGARDRTLPRQSPGPRRRLLGGVTPAAAPQRGICRASRSRG